MTDERHERLERFIRERQRQNTRILESEHLGLKRFFGLDESAYRDGVLDVKTKEMLGLVASMVLRCNDCIDYHLIQCVQLGATEEEMIEVFNIGLLVGGSIVIPHLRHAFDTLDVLLEKKAETQSSD